MRFHLLGLAHTKTNRDYMACAYTQKVYKLSRMLTRFGHEVIHYGAEGADVPCEHVPVVTSEIQRECYGDYDWTKDFFKHDPQDLAYQTFNANAIREINARKQDGDVLLVSFGNYQQPISECVNIPYTVEMGIGYTGVFAPYRVFESYAWMHYVYGLLQQADGSWYDAVIPNYFDVNDFAFRREPGEYLAFIGRLISRKGLQIALDVARYLKRPLKVAGQGSLAEFNTEGVDVEHVGMLNAGQRSQFLSHALATFVPTLYIEPFGGVAVESQLCGTPVLTTDWGVFSETVLHGVTGYRCRTSDDFIFAASQAAQLDRLKVRRWAAENYSMDRVAYMYQEYFSKIADLGHGGWGVVHPERQELGWMVKQWQNCG